MKRLLLTAALLVAWSASAQPILRNSVTTNDLSTNLVWNPGGKALNIRGASPELDFWNTSGATDFKRYTLSASSSQLRFHLTTDNGGSTVLLGYWATNGDFVVQGGLSLSGNTNRYTDNGSQLLRNGVAVGGSGSGVSTVVTPLAYSGTNITGFDCTTNNATFTLTLTNHCLFNAASFTGLPNTTTNVFFTLGLKQDGTGTWVPKFTNSIITWADGVQPVIKTNANAVSFLYFHSHLFTNGMLVGSPNINVQ